MHPWGYKPTPDELAGILARHKRWAAKAEGWSNDDYADLRGADLHGANLYGANLYGADLHGAKGNQLVLAQTEIVPREGSFIGWKACRSRTLVKLRIPDDALRSNAMGRRCRASKAEVLEIARFGKTPSVAISQYDSSFVYRVGETVEVKNFDTDRMNECAPGIHFFLTPEEAIEWF